MNGTIDPAKAFSSFPKDKKAVVEFLNENLPGYCDLVFPDQTPGSIKEIDATAELFGHKVAIEHTSMVRFIQERASNAQFPEIKEGLKECLSRFPPGHFRVLVSCKDYGGKRNRTKLVNFMSEYLPDLAASLKKRRGLPFNVAYNGVPFWVYRYDDDLNEVEIRQFNPEAKKQFPEMRDKIIEKSLKLKKYEAMGYWTFLLLEGKSRDSVWAVLPDVLMELKTDHLFSLDEAWEIHEDSERIKYVRYGLDSYYKRSPVTKS